MRSSPPFPLSGDVALLGKLEFLWILLPLVLWHSWEGRSKVRPEPELKIQRGKGFFLFRVHVMATALLLCLVDRMNKKQARLWNNLENRGNVTLLLDSNPGAASIGPYGAISALY